MRFKQILNNKSIRIAALGSIGVKFSSALFALLNAILLTNLLSVEGFGIYILAFTTVTILSIPLNMGLPELLTRFISKYEVNEEYGLIKGLLIRSNGLVLIAFSGFILLAFALYEVWWHAYDEEVRKTFWYSFTLLPLLLLGELRAAALRGLRYVILGQLPDTFLRNVFFCLFLTFYFVSGYDFSPHKAMIAHAFAAFIAFLIGAYFLRVKILKKIQKEVPKYDNKFWFKQTLPFTVISSVQVIKARSLPYFLVYFWNAEMVAIFDIAQRGGSLVSFTMDALNKTIAPHLSNAFEKSDKIRLQQIVKRAGKLVFALSVPIALVFIFGGKPVIGYLFGEEYIESYIPLVVLCIGHLFNSIVGPVSTLLGMTGNQNYLSRNQVMMMIISFVISIPLISNFGALGAALVFSIILIAQNITLVRYVRREIGVDSVIF